MRHSKGFFSVMDKRQHEQDFFFFWFFVRFISNKSPGELQLHLLSCGFIAAESIQDMTPSRLNLLPSLHYHNQIYSGDSDRFHFAAIKTF